MTIITCDGHSKNCEKTFDAGNSRNRTAVQQQSEIKSSKRYHCGNLHHSHKNKLDAAKCALKRKASKP